MSSFLIALSALCVSVALAWDYTNEASWISDYPMCGGNSQSPIHLRPLEAQAIRTSSIVLTTGCDFLPNQSFAVTDFNFTFGVTFGSEVECYISVGKSVPARLTALYFHMGSEHAVQGSYYGMESQWQFERNDTTKMMLSMMLAANFVDIPVTAPSVFAQAAIEQLPPKNGSFVLPTNVTLSSWITGLNYFTYSGSLTMPPCTENVDWVIVKEPVHIPRTSHLRFSNAMRLRTPNFDDVGGNARPLQPDYKRVVQYHVTSKALDVQVQIATKSRNSHIVAIVMVICVGLVICALYAGSKGDAYLKKQELAELAQKQAQSTL